MRCSTLADQRFFPARPNLVPSPKKLVLHGLGPGVASLDGAISLNATPTYQALLGDSLELLDYQSLKGTFNSIHVPVLAPSLQWIPTYGNTNFQLRISAQSPQP